MQQTDAPAYFPAEPVLQSQDWDFPFENLHGLDDRFLRAKLLWEMGRHLVIDPQSGARPVLTENGKIAFEEGMEFQPLGRLGDKFSKYFPGNKLAVLAVEKVFIQFRARAAGPSIASETEMVRWIPRNYPAWDASESVAEHARFIQLAWPAPLEPFHLRSDADVDSLANEIKSHLRYLRERGHNSNDESAHLCFFLRSFAWECYPRSTISAVFDKMLRSAAGEAGLRVEKGAPKGLTSRQFAARIEDLALLRLALAYGPAKAQAEASNSTHEELRKLARLSWSDDWARRCKRSVALFRKLFPGNSAVKILQARLDAVTRG